MHHRTLSEEGFEKFRKPTRRERFLAEMNTVMPWAGLCGMIEPFCPTVEDAGRPPIGVERMLRIHFLRHWFNLSDPAVEEGLYDSGAMRRFVGIDLGREPAPDETTICGSPSIGTAVPAGSAGIEIPDGCVRMPVNGFNPGLGLTHPGTV